MANRRQNTRVSIPLEAHFESLSGTHAARVGDVGLGGCYVESLALVSIGEQIRFEVHLPTGRWLHLQGEVVYSQPNLGFGLRFINQSKLEREMLELIIEYGS